MTPSTIMLSPKVGPLWTHRASWTWSVGRDLGWRGAVGVGGGRGRRETGLVRVVGTGCADLLPDALPALVVEPVRLRLHDLGDLLDVRPVEHLAGLGHHGVVLLPSRPGAEHVTHPGSGYEDPLFDHHCSFLDADDIPTSAPRQSR